MEISANNYPTKPRVIYDGDCGYCVYSVNYWHKLTGDVVDYQPYQSVAKEYPAIPVEEFQRAVQYIAPNGEVARAAKASFLTLSHAPGKAYWLWLYQTLPGFAFISEIVYFLISHNRNTVYFISRMLWGSHYVPSTYSLATWLFVRSFALIFLAAFISFNSQALGLIGSEGILPVAELVKAGHQQLGMGRYWQIPMVFWANSSDTMIQLVCGGGIAFSLLLLLNIYPRVCLLLLYVLYLSLIYAANVFMSFQWDLLLVEISPIAIVLLSERTLGIWLLRWLLFRFVLAGGLVKITSGDPSWLNFTALNYHFFTQPLPTPLAWYVQQLPEVFRQFSTFMTLVIELGIVFLIFTPRRIRFFAGFAILFLQLLILLTGNYNFFNLTAMALCLSLYDDAALTQLIPAKLSCWINNYYKEIKRGRLTFLLCMLFAITTIPLSLIEFGLRFGIPTPVVAAQLSDSVAPLRLVNVYGPFAFMTKNRYEIILEGSTDGVNWYEYDFKYKPGDVNRPLQWNIPFQPRVDWQMWFAALSEPSDNIWFYHFVERLLQNSPTVTALLAYNPFPVTGPTYIRARFYDYEFTNSEERKDSGAVWKRTYIKEYLPSVKLS